MGGYTPFSSGFGGFQFNNPMDEEAERRKREELELAEQTSLRQSMATDPSFDDPVADVSGKLPDMQEPKPTGSITDDDPVGRGLEIAGEGDTGYMEQYAEHLGNRPQREDYDVSTLRKVLSVIGGTMAGGDPRVTRALAGGGKFDEALQQWEATGQGLGDVAELQSLNQRSRNTMGSSAMSAGASEVGSRRGQENAEAAQPAKDMTAEAAKTNATSTAARVPIQNAAEARRAESGSISANASRSRAETYASDVGAPEQQGSRLWDRTQPVDPIGAQLLPKQEEDARRAATLNVVNEDPDYEYFMNKYGEAEMYNSFFSGDASDQAIFEKFKQRIDEELEERYPGMIRTTKTPLAGSE